MLCSSIDNQLRVRVTDAALARDIFPQDYHCLGDNENRPVKWLAIESLVLRKFSPASDVVSCQLATQLVGPVEFNFECLTSTTAKSCSKSSDLNCSRLASYFSCRQP